MASSRLGCNDGFMLAGRMRDRRGHTRGRISRMVQVAREGDAAFARCHDFSDTGMKLDLTGPLAINDEVSVALSSSVMLFGTVAWIEGDECGIAFDDPVDSLALLDAADGGRSPSDARATLDLLHGRQAGVNTVAAQRGSKTSAAVKFEPGLAVTVMIGASHEQRAVLRWAHGNIARIDLVHTDLRPSRQSHGILPGPDAD